MTFGILDSTFLAMNTAAEELSDGQAGVNARRNGRSRAGNDSAGTYNNASPVSDSGDADTDDGPLWAPSANGRGDFRTQTTGGGVQNGLLDSFQGAEVSYVQQPCPSYASSWNGARHKANSLSRPAVRNGDSVSRLQRPHDSNTSPSMGFGNLRVNSPQPTGLPLDPNRLPSFPYVASPDTVIESHKPDIAGSEEDERNASYGRKRKVGTGKKVGIH
jgi:hypothetical protein